VIIRAADKDFAPRLRMCRRKIVTIREFVDFLPRQLFKESPGKIAQKRVAQSVDTLKMFKEKDQLLEMSCFQFAIHAVKRMRDRMRDLRRLQIALQLKDIIPGGFDLSMLLL